MTKNISNIEKCAKLMGDDFYENFINYAPAVENWNPLTNKSDLMDLECALHKFGMFSVTMYCAAAIVRLEEYADTRTPRAPELFEDMQFYIHHDTYFTPRAHAVIAVAVQIFVRRLKYD